MKTHIDEDYIDLIPVLENLYIDADEFLEPIKKVRVSRMNYDEFSKNSLVIANGEW